MGFKVKLWSESLIKKKKLFVVNNFCNPVTKSNCYQWKKSKTNERPVPTLM